MDSPDNAFKNVVEDKYIFKGDVDASAQQTTIDLGNNPSDFYRVVIEGKYNMVNTWSPKK